MTRDGTGEVQHIPGWLIEAENTSPGDEGHRNETDFAIGAVDSRHVLARISAYFEGQRSAEACLEAQSNEKTQLYDSR